MPGLETLHHFPKWRFRCLPTLKGQFFTISIVAVGDQFFHDRGIHIEHDPKQNRYSGLPEAWKAAIPQQCVDELSGMQSDIPEFLIPTNHKVDTFFFFDNLQD